ncbi:hypothetical protein [Rhizobium sp. NZLR11]|uniref:hypothetical protein n=1 Tax=Rhizobium sp. NZLR11 TaxID=2731098 RepID=UPI001C83557B|nr:hypothetical protein [Rhizobium sp. NZLR11]MBX5206730.1 hypothetical protein [Rhizobium sp. NZLR11]
MSPAEYGALALTAKKDARDYRREARMSNPERRKMLLKWAGSRDEDAAFYASRALINEDYQRRHAPKQEAA